MALGVALAHVFASPGIALAADSGFVKQLLAQPPREYSSAPLWVWNDQLTEEQIVGTLRDLAGQQVKQVFVHPRPGLMTPYLSTDWFRLWRAALGEAQRLDMNVWIYDENSYPSGFAGGFVPESMPEARGRGLNLRATDSVPRWTPDLLAVYRLSHDSCDNVTAAVRAGESFPVGSYVTASVVRTGNSPWHGGKCYVDLLYPGVTEKFLEITLGAYKRELGDQLGKRIPGIFTDEPNITPAGGLPWTEDLPLQFEKRWGYDLLAHLPSLAHEVGDWRRVRHDYYSVLNQLFIDRWARPYAEQCAKLRLEMTGHYWEHDWPNCGGVPDNMAMYAWEQRPAIDCLMNQYAEHTHAQFGNIRSVRELNSIANQLGKPRTLCEVYGAGGWDLRFEDMKRQADWLAVLGVNTFDQHLSYVTLRGARKRDHPQSFSYHEPWWEAYRAQGTYLERLSVAVSQGRQLNRILVIEPTTTAWMYQGKASNLKPLGDAFFALLKVLEAAQVEYDLGCEDVIARHGSATAEGLKIGERIYTTVVLPPLMENLDGRTWDLLETFLEQGGKALACGATESIRRDGAVASAKTREGQLRRCPRVDAQAVPGLLLKATDGFAIRRRPDDQGILFHMRRVLDDGEVLLLVNTSIEFPSAGVITSGLRGVEQWGLENGKTSRYPFEWAGADGVRATFQLPPCGSLLLFLSKERLEPGVAVGQDARVVPTAGPVRVTRIEPNVLVLDFVDLLVQGERRTNIYFYQANQLAFQKHGMERNPWDSAVQFKDELIRKTFPATSGFTVTYRFTISDRVPPNLAAVIERPDLYVLTCNGAKLTAAPQSWWLDKAFGRIDLAAVARVGENDLTLTATPFTVYHEIEPAYLLGDFTLRANGAGFSIAADQGLTWGRWNEQGHPFYAAGVSYQQRFVVKKSASDAFVITLPKWFGSVARVLVNGRQLGVISAPPWRCHVTEGIQDGENTVEVVAIGTLKNTLGPHHGKPALGTAWPGMFQKAPASGPPAGGDYSTAGYGLDEPFTLGQLTPE